MAEEQINGFSPAEQSGSEKALTPIHRGIHCAATPGTNDDATELDVIAINHFLDTMAELALAIVRRRKRLEQ